jgi:hypothetical protein
VARTAAEEKIRKNENISGSPSIIILQWGNLQLINREDTGKCKAG